jgi:hypothetical protein
VEIVDFLSLLDEKVKHMRMGDEHKVDICDMLPEFTLNNILK